MHPAENSKSAAPPALRSGGSVDALPDGVLEHILGFLLAPEAVRTCVLARRWRDLWMSAPALRVGCLHDDVHHDLPPVKENRKLMDRLLLVRGGLPLDTCDIRFGEFEPGDVPRLNFWVRHAISCKASLIRLHIQDNFCYLDLDDLPLVSQHLTRLELHGVRINCSFLDFSSCPALEYLELFDCNLMKTKNISSDSLKHLSIGGSLFSDKFSEETTDDNLTRIRTRIYAPNLVSLCLDRLKNFTPLLESMPSLVEAFIQITEGWLDCCFKQMLPECICELCDSSCGGTGYRCVLFEGLSMAESLVLICCTSNMNPHILFKRDLRWCPVFSKLKTLLLNEYWCMPDDFGPLLCILKHSPVLEELTIELFSQGPRYEVEMKGSINPMERSATILEHLNIVKIKCQVVDERVLNVLKFLCTFNIR